MEAGASDALKFRIAGVLVATIGIAILIRNALTLTGGEFVYTLDDPYIHLAVAQSILEGGYGINTGEFASPSSSILYPFLLALLLALGFGTFAPLAVSVPATLGTTWILCGLIWRFGVRFDSLASRRFAFIALPLVLLAINAFALPLTGMEHSLHVLAVLLVVAGFAAPGGTGASTAALLAGIVLGPLVRFEGLALSGAAIVALLFLGRIRVATLATAVLAVLFGAYFYAMSRMGLPLLPSSVLVKSDVSSSLADAGFAASLERAANGVIEALGGGRGQLLAISLLALLAALWRRVSGPERPTALIVAAAAAIAAHLAVGRYGWFSRYEVYAIALSMGALVVSYGPPLRGLPRAGLLRIGLVVALIVTALPYAGTTFLTPRASENIFLQQGQMHTFATEHFPEPVAVMDLGYVAFDNPNHVLDLWGLGSEEARQRRTREGFGPDDLRALTASRGSVYAMIYDEWLGEFVPGEWCRIAVLTTPKVISASAEVAFYLVDANREADMRAALDRFASALPAKASLETAPCF